MIKDDFFIIFVDSMLLDRVCFVVYIVAKRPIDCIFVCVELFLLRFERVGNEYCRDEIFIKSIISIRYFLQCLYWI